MWIRFRCTAKSFLGTIQEYNKEIFLEIATSRRQEELAGTERKGSND